MSAPLEVPTPEDLASLGLDVQAAEEPWIVSVSAAAKDGDEVVITWDEISGSVHVRWMNADETRLVLEREIVAKVSIQSDRDGLEFRIWSRSAGVTGELTVRVGAHVAVQDALLRT